ncbi:hypothetical protein GEV33_000213 [Tenebrio molitor]|uniref:Uncharacterized protein n=1 Tax=Tenebrio molitor TaxID=7067 RepID=A0A8J6LKQ5_TENMO|nr:hypothetical protein GEV33_000213 [Tenebrio molitor]
MYFVAFLIAFGKMCFPMGSPGLIIWALVTSRDAINPIKVRARIVFSQVAAAISGLMGPLVDTLSPIGGTCPENLYLSGDPLV